MSRKCIVKATGSIQAAVPVPDIEWLAAGAVQRMLESNLNPNYETYQERLTTQAGMPIAVVVEKVGANLVALVATEQELNGRAGSDQTMASGQAD